MNRIHCALVGSLTLLVAATGCSKKEAESPAQGAQGVVGAEQGAGSTFRFMPQSRSFTQRTVDTKTLSSPGTSFTSEVKGQYLWDVSAVPEGANVTYNAQLRQVILGINGQNAVNETPPANQVQIRVDGSGQVLGVTGAESLAQGLMANVAPENREAARGLIDQAARSAIAERFQLTVQDLQGRPTALGSSWTVRSQSGGPVRSKTWTVRGKEVCGTAQCMRVDSTYDIDSQAIASQLKGDLAGQGTGGNEVQLSDVTVTAKDSVLVEPNTLYLHSARFEQTARVILEREGRRQPMLITEVRDLSTQTR